MFSQIASIFPAVAVTAFNPKGTGPHSDQEYPSSFQFIDLFFSPHHHDPWPAATFGSKQNSPAKDSSGQQGAVTEN